MCIFINAKYPCGHCYQCLSKIRNDWSIRLQSELKESKTAYHAILTYGDENLPRSKNGLATVNKSDFVKFMKRFRHNFDYSIKFFAVSEYGGTTLRPHYHVIFFGVPFFDDTRTVYNSGLRYDISEKMRQMVEKSWQKGFVRYLSSYVKEVAQLHYVLKDLYNWYNPLDLDIVYNKLSKDKSKCRELLNYRRNTFDPFIRCGRDDDREKTFRLMSKNLGAGLISELSKDIPDTSRFDYFMSWDSPYIRDHFSIKKKQDFLEQQRKLYDSLTYDNNGRIILPDDVCNIRDFFEFDISQLDKSSRKKTSRTVRVALPKYYRQKLFSRGFRELLNRNNNINRHRIVSDYLAKYGEYDANHDRPMYLEQANLLWKLHASRHKDILTDKLFNNQIF